MELKAGKKVIYQGFEYTLIWIFDNKYCEIQNTFTLLNRVVKISDLKPLECTLPAT